jgi:hypothetical protein
MFTIYYKGWYIHGYCDKPETHVTPCQNIESEGIRTKFKSMHSAKIYITKTIRGQTR